MARGQADACPYLRPFSDDFDECPAYRQLRFLAVDLQYRPLRTVNTCANLEAASLPGRQAGFYPRCAIGDAAARRAWAARIEGERLVRIRRLARALADATRDASREMWEAKADQLRSSRPSNRETRRMRRAAQAYEAAARGFLQRHRGDLGELGIDLEAVLDLIREAIAEWATPSSAFASYRPSPRILERFPPDVQAFLSPNAS